MMENTYPHIQNWPKEGCKVTRQPIKPNLNLQSVILHIHRQRWQNIVLFIQQFYLVDGGLLK